MKLFDYLKMTEEDSEITITDKEYDTETYVYNSQPSDKWDELIIELEKMVDVVEVKSWGTVVVDFTKLLESKIDKISKADLFRNNEIEDLVCTMDGIISGNVSESWLEKFIEILKF